MPANKDAFPPKSPSFVKKPDFNPSEAPKDVEKRNNPNANTKVEQDEPVKVEEPKKVEKKPDAKKVEEPEPVAGHPLGEVVEELPDEEPVRDRGYGPTKTVHDLYKQG